jgi:hypothetical protein
MIKNVTQLCEQLTDLIGEETLQRELEGILRKHRGIACRTRKPGHVDLCLSLILDLEKRGKNITPRQVAIIAIPYNLSPASLYRLTRALLTEGIRVRAADVLKEQEWLKAGVY